MSEIDSVPDKQQKALEASISVLREELEAYERFQEYELQRRLPTIRRLFRTIVQSPKPDTEFQTTASSMKVLRSRYLKKDEEGNPIETPEERLWNVASWVAVGRAIVDEDETENTVHQRARDYYSLMVSRGFMPNSPTLMNAGKELGQLSGCFVLQVLDNTRSIFNAIMQTAMIHKSGGGTGFSFSRLRPKNDSVSSTHGVASGPVSFMRVFDSATEEIKQGGTRRGANMGILNVDHPDIIDFITCKEGNRAQQNFNLSVGITEEWYEKAQNGEDFDLINPRNGAVTGRLNAQKVLEMIVERAWKNGDPGVVFIDRLNRDNPTPDVGMIESTNPCGEQPLLPYESCNLGSINLANIVSGNKIDYDKLRAVARRATEFLNDVIEINCYPLPQVWEMTHANRKVGLGIMGFADMLVQLGIRYDSEEGIKIAREVMKTVRDTAVETSRELAKKYGAFPNFKGSVFSKRGEPEQRNATLTTIAPTGTISIIANASSGIEPYFAISYVREKVLDGDPMPEVNGLFEQIAKKRGFYSEGLMKKIAGTGSVQGLEEVPEDVQALFRTALDISPEWHIRMQAAFQESTDNAVSKTVNMPNSATIDDVMGVYNLAFELGCKGVTIYRDGSRDQVLNIGNKKDPLEQLREEVHKLRVVAYGEKNAGRLKRGKVTPAFVIKEPYEDSNAFITIGYIAGEVGEAFVNVPKPTPRESEYLRDIAITTSRSIQDGVRTPEKIAEDKLGVDSGVTAHDSWGSNTSLSDAFGKALIQERFRGMDNFPYELERKMLETEMLLLKGLILTREKKKAKQEMITQVMNGSGKLSLETNVQGTPLPLTARREACPNCHSTEYMMIRESGCETYSCCWYSKCG